MSNGEAKTLETDVVIYQMKFANESEKQITDETQKTEASDAEAQPQKTASRKTDLFARLKKSARKKSISIL